METKNLPWRDSSTRFLTSDFFSWIDDWSPDSYPKLFSYGVDSRKNIGRKSRATVPLKSSEYKKNTWQWKTAKNFKLLHCQNYPENCDSEGLKLRTSEKIAVAKLRLRSNISLKNCRIAIAEVLPSSCRIAIADSKKSCMCPSLVVTHFSIWRIVPMVNW